MVAHDDKKPLAMLRRRAPEAFADLLIRLDAAIARAQYTGSRVDEIDKPSSDVPYESSLDAITAHAEHGNDQFMDHVNSLEDRRSSESRCQRHKC